MFKVPRNRAQAADSLKAWALLYSPRTFSSLSSSTYSLTPTLILRLQSRPTTGTHIPSARTSACEDRTEKLGRKGGGRGKKNRRRGQERGEERTGRRERRRREAQDKTSFSQSLLAQRLFLRPGHSSMIHFICAVFTYISKYGSHFFLEQQL